MTLLSGMAYAFDPCLWHRADQEEFWHEVEVTQYHMDQELGTNISCRMSDGASPGVSPGPGAAPCRTVLGPE